MACPACFSGHIHAGNPRGKVVKLHDLDTYMTEPSDGKEIKGIIIIIPDAFGWDFVNNRLLADHYADKGRYRVYLPDFMLGTSIPGWTLNLMQTVLNPGGFIGIFKKAYTIPWLLYMVTPWIIFNRIGRSYPIVKKFFTALRHGEGATLPVGAAGFCWGGKHIALLGADTDLVDGQMLFDAGFTAHPSFLSIPYDIERIRLPVSFACPENDTQVSVAQVEQIRSVVEAKPEGEKGEAVLYKGCGHGFSIRADLSKGDPKKQALEAEDQCIRWFDRHFGLDSK